MARKGRRLMCEPRLISSRSRSRDGSRFTIFSVPKPFDGATALIQENAIGSWTRLGAHQEVLLYGNDAGVAEAAGRLGARHLPELTYSEYGTPLVSHLFASAQAHATHDWLCYVNCDIVLTSDLPRAIERLAAHGRPVMASGRRWRVGIARPLRFEPGWEAEWRTDVARSAVATR